MARDDLHFADRRWTLCIQIRTALMDQYERHAEGSLNYTLKKQEHQAGPPTIKTATAQQGKRLQLTGERQHTQKD